MKCPHCGYEHGWSPETSAKVLGNEGNFFFLSNSIKMVTVDEGFGNCPKERNLVGCPACNALFMKEA